MEPETPTPQVPPVPTPTPPEVPPVPEQPFVPTPPAPNSAEDPGKVMAIVGIVLAFVFALAGLIVSIIANKKSKAAGFHNSLASVGIILNVVFLVLQLLVGTIFVVAIIASVQQNAAQQQQQ